MPLGAIITLAGAAGRHQLNTPLRTAHNNPTEAAAVTAQEHRSRSQSPRSPAAALRLMMQHGPLSYAVNIVEGQGNYLAKFYATHKNSLELLRGVIYVFGSEGGNYMHHNICKSPGERLNN